MSTPWLPDDYARCSGEFPSISSSLYDCCKDCLRRTAKRTADYGPWIGPQVVDSKCEYRIDPTDWSLRRIASK